MSSRPNDQGNLIVLKAHSRVPPRCVSTISQEDLEELLLRRRRAAEALRYLQAKEELIASALTDGADVEAGVHSAELVAEHRNGVHGELILKLVIFIVLLAAPLFGPRGALVGDLNGDGRVDIVDIALALSGAGSGRPRPSGAARVAVL